MLSAFVAMLLLSAANGSYAQSCGNGTNKITIYVRNGLNAVNTRYEIYPASPLRYRNENGAMRKLEKVAEYLSTTFFPLEEVYFSRWWSRPRTVRKDDAERFINSYDPRMFEAPVIDAKLENFSFSGKITDDSLSFVTYEMDDMPLLLKITADNYEPVYVLGMHRGGCSRNYDLLLTKYIEPTKNR
jgi:hypothetical protein